MLQGRDPIEMLEALGVRGAKGVVATRAPSPRSIDPEEVAAAARSLGTPAETAETPPLAVQRALELAGPLDLVLVCGSLYVVGSARAALVGEPTTHH